MIETPAAAGRGVDGLHVQGANSLPEAPIPAL
jgi:hypothetical protein